MKDLLVALLVMAALTITSSGLALHFYLMAREATRAALEHQGDVDRCEGTLGPELERMRRQQHELGLMLGDALTR